MSTPPPLPCRKSSNVLLGRDGTAKIGEQLLLPSQDCCNTLDIIIPCLTHKQTLHYMAPGVMPKPSDAVHSRCTAQTALSQLLLPAADVGFANVLSNTHLTLQGAVGTFAYAGRAQLLSLLSMHEQPMSCCLLQHSAQHVGVCTQAVSTASFPTPVKPSVQHLRCSLGSTATRGLTSILLGSQCMRCSPASLRGVASCGTSSESRSTQGSSRTPTKGFHGCA